VNQIAGEPELHAEVLKLYRMFPERNDHPQQPNNVNLDTLTALIPPKVYCDRLMEFYCLNFESIYRILHLPTFLSDYQQFWDPGATRASSPSFTSHLALVTAMSLAVSLPQSSTDKMALSSFNARKTCSLVEAWLSDLSNQHNAQTSTIQSFCLLVLAKQMIGTPSDQLCHLTSRLIRLALTIGLHRDPEEFTSSGMSMVQIEGRRRLWFTIMELDVQASTSCGSPSLVQTIEYTCQYPAQIDDLTSVSNSERHVGFEFGSATTAQTDLQIVLARSLPLRLTALRVLTSIEPDTVEIDELLQQLEKQRLLLSSLTVLSHDAYNPEVLLKTIMGDMCLRRLMISLYTLQLQRIPGTDYVHIQEIANRFIDTAMGVIAHSDNLDPDLTSYITVEDGRQRAIFQALHGRDLIRAANGACLAMKVLASDPPTSATTPGLSQSPAAYMTWPKSAIRRMVEGVIKTLIMKTPHLRSSLKEIVRLTLVAELVRQEGTWENKERRMRTGMERFFQLCRERYAMEGDTASVQNGLVLEASPQSTPDFGDFFASPGFNFDAFGFDLSVDPMPNMNF
jgi:hypothetical protein